MRRPGVIDTEVIETVIEKKIYESVKNTKNPNSPGQFFKHYSPRTPIKLNVKKAKKNSEFITIGKKFKKNKDVYNLSEKSNLEEAAKNLYKTF